MSNHMQSLEATIFDTDTPTATRLLLLLERGSNRDRLIEWLPTEYQVVPFDGNPTDLAFDLCIVDEPMLERHRESLVQKKELESPTFLPYLLVSNASSGRKLDRAYTLVDEILEIPTQKATLRTRLRNLTERRAGSLRLADELGQQRELFRRIFESSNDAIVVIDPNAGSIKRCNPQACELLEYSETALRSLSPRDIYPNDFESYREFRDGVLEEGRGWTEIACVTQQGNRLDCEVSGSAISIDDSPHLVASIRDVSKRTEQRRIMNGLHDVTTDLMDAAEKPEVADVVVDAAKRVFGYDIVGVRLLNEDRSPETLDVVAATERVREIVGPDPPSYERGEGPVGRVFEANESRIIDDLRWFDVPFEYEPIQSALCLPLGDEGVLSIGATDTNEFDDTDEELLQILATNASVALERANREQTLRDRTRDLSGLFENTTDSIADIEFVDGTPTVRDVNETFERVFGYDREAIQGRSLPDLVVPPAEEQSSKRLIEHTIEGTQIEVETRRKTATGHRDFLVRAVPIQRSDSNLGAYVVYTDISDQKQRSQQFQVLNRVLRHNLRNKLNIVRGTLAQVNRGGEITDSLTGEGIDAIDEILSLSETARDLANGIQPKNNLEPVAISDATDNVATTLDEAYPTAKISTDVRTEQRIDGRVNLEWALTELCENAITHTDDPEPMVEIEAYPRSKHPDWVEIQVADDGPGIPEDQRSVLEKGKETQLEHTDGLGLWTVQWIVTGAGGEFLIEDHDEHGSVVTMRLCTVDADRTTRGASGIDTNE